MPRQVDDRGMAGGIRVPGIYQRRVERERENTNNGDPRRIYANPNNADEGFTMTPTALFHQLEAGEPVRVPWWRLGGHMVPDERIRRLKREDRSITGWLVKPDDTVQPLR